MKKVKVLIICGVLSLGIAACGEHEVKQVDTIEENYTESESVESNEELVLSETEKPVDETKEVDSVEEIWIEGPVVLRGATFYPPLTCAEAVEQGIEYDGIMDINGVSFVTYDWVEGDDNMEEDFPDSDMTVDSYAEVMGGHAARKEELEYLMSQFPVADPEYGFGWPTTYWLGEWWGDRESEEDASPLLYDLEGYWDGEGAAYEFPPFNLPVIVVVGEMYEPDYIGLMEMREKEFADDGSGYFVNMLWDVENEIEELMTIYLDEHTLVFDESGYLVDVDSLVSSQLSMEIIMDEAGEFAAKIYILPFVM